MNKKCSAMQVQSPNPWLSKTGLDDFTAHSYHGNRISIFLFAKVRHDDVFDKFAFAFHSTDASFITVEI